MLLHANPLFFKELRNGSCMLKIVGHISLVRHEQSVSICLILSHLYSCFLPVPSSVSKTNCVSKRRDSSGGVKKRGRFGSSCIMYETRPKTPSVPAIAPFTISLRFTN